MNIDAGYLPYTLLNISTKYRGANANTATPVLINQENNVVNLDNWQQHLRGELFTRYEGDHITPANENHSHRIPAQTGGSAFPGGTAYTTYQVQVYDPHHFAVLGRQYAWQLQHISGGTNLNQETVATEFNGAIDGSWIEFKKMEIKEDIFYWA